MIFVEFTPDNSKDLKSYVVGTTLEAALAKIKPQDDLFPFPPHQKVTKAEVRKHCPEDSINKAIQSIQGGQSKAQLIEIP